MADCFQVLLESPIILLFDRIELISILFANLCINLLRKLRINGDSLRFLEHVLLEKVFDF